MNVYSHERELILTYPSFETALLKVSIKAFSSNQRQPISNMVYKLFKHIKEPAKIIYGVKLSTSKYFPNNQIIRSERGLQTRRRQQ